MKRRNKLFIAVAILVCGITGMALIPILDIVLSQGNAVADAIDIAEREFKQSRGHVASPPGSDEFDFFGIQPGMSESEVEALLPKARAVRRGGISDTPKWGGTVNDYEFSYGPIVGTMRDKTFIPVAKELLCVYFDKCGKARLVSLTRVGELFTGLAERRGVVPLDSLEYVRIKNLP